MPLARQVSELNTKFYRNPSKKLEDMERTQNRGSNIWPPSVTSSQNGWLIPSAHRLSELNIWSICYQHLSKKVGDVLRTPNVGSNIRPFKCDLNLGQNVSVKPSAHRISNLSIWALWTFFNKCGRYRADWKRRLKPDIQVWPWSKMARSCHLHIVSVSLTFKLSFMKILHKCGKYGADTKLGLKHFTLKCDLAFVVNCRIHAYCTSSQCAKHICYVSLKSFE